MRSGSTCDFRDLPQWLMQDSNGYLHKGHRPPSDSIAWCLKSIFHIHTETVNIWSHLLAALAFLIGFLNFCYSCSLPLGDAVVIAASFLGAIFSFVTSTAYHTAMCHSPRINLLTVKCDHAGIAVVVTVMTVGHVYFWFYHDPFLSTLYSTLISMVGFYVAVTIVGNSGITKAKRFMGFFSIGAVSVLPLAHFVLSFGWSPLTSSPAFPFYIMGSGVNILGGSLYALKIPERFCPGKCDILFNSHQFLHLCVTGGAYFYLRGFYEMSISKLIVLDS